MNDRELATLILAAWDEAATPLPGSTFHNGAGFARDNWASIRLILRALLDETALPLDPEPWTIHSADYGTIRFPNREECWAGYRAHFEPRDGYSQNRADYA